MIRLFLACPPAFYASFPAKVVDLTLKQRVLFVEKVAPFVLLLTDMCSHSFISKIKEGKFLTVLQC